MRAIAIFPIALILALKFSFIPITTVSASNIQPQNMLGHISERLNAVLFVFRWNILQQILNLAIQRITQLRQNSRIQSCHSSFTKLVQLCPLHLCSVCQFILTDSLFFNHFIQLNPDAAIIQIFHILLPSTTILL